MTATPEPVVELTDPLDERLDDEVLDDELFDELMLDEVDAELMTPAAKAVVVVELDEPGMVAALTTPSTPRPAIAPMAMPAVRRLRRRVAASRAVIFDCRSWSPFMADMLPTAPGAGLGEPWEMAEK